MFDWLFDGIAGLLSFFFELTGSIGSAIILLTLALLLLTAPLTMRSTRRMMQVQRDMARLQPKMKAIQKEFAGDRLRMNQEMQKLYEEEEVSPFAMLGGCFPLILQAPIFIVMFQVLRGLGNVDVENGREVVDPKYIDHGSQLYDKIVDAGGQLVSWGFDLADAATSSHASFVDALPYYTLVALTGVTAWYQTKLMASRRDRSGPQAEVNPQAKMMQRIMPMMLPVISLSIPAGVVVYFVVSNVFRIGQQALIHRLEEGSGTGETTAREKPRPAKASTPPPTSSDPVEKRPATTSPRPHPRSKKKKRKKRSR